MMFHEFHAPLPHRLTEWDGSSHQVKVGHLWPSAAGGMLLIIDAWCYTVTHLYYSISYCKCGSNHWLENSRTWWPFFIIFWKVLWTSQLLYYRIPYASTFTASWLCWRRPPWVSVNASRTTGEQQIVPWLSQGLGAGKLFWDKIWQLNYLRLLIWKIWKAFLQCINS